VRGNGLLAPYNGPGLLGALISLLLPLVILVLFGFSKYDQRKGRTPQRGVGHVRCVQSICVLLGSSRPRAKRAAARNCLSLLC
jgi:hypothetical protein